MDEYVTLQKCHQLLEIDKLMIRASLQVWSECSVYIVLTSLLVISSFFCSRCILCRQALKSMSISDAEVCFIKMRDSSLLERWVSLSFKQLTMLALMMGSSVATILTRWFISYKNIQPIMRRPPEVHDLKGQN